MAQIKEFPFDESSEGVAIFAGGCFWCMEAPFEEIPGVIEVYSGYCGGVEKFPTYEQVSSGVTSHIESVLVKYDSTIVTYQELLNIFWQNINPIQRNGQFHDIGSQYRTAILFINNFQQQQAQISKENLQKSKKFSKPIATEIIKATTFWIAEEYHQDYYKKNPQHYQRYKEGSGRAEYIKKTWAK